MDITKIMFKLINDNSELSIFGGVGYCGYGSCLLEIELNKLNVPCILLYGYDINRDTVMGKRAVAGQKSNVLAITSKGDSYAVTKEKFAKAGNKFATRAGHVVVLINDTVYDITSRQFGFPQVYTLEDFLSVWNKAYTCTLTIDKDKDFYTGILTKKENLSRETITESFKAVVVESFKSVVKTIRTNNGNQENTPRYFSW